MLGFSYFLWANIQPVLSLMSSMKWDTEAPSCPSAYWTHKEFGTWPLSLRLEWGTIIVQEETPRTLSLGPGEPMGKSGSVLTRFPETGKLCCWFLWDKYLARHRLAINVSQINEWMKQELGAENWKQQRPNWKSWNSKADWSGSRQMEKQKTPSRFLIP